MYHNTLNTIFNFFYSKLTLKTSFYRMRTLFYGLKLPLQIAVNLSLLQLI